MSVICYNLFVFLTFEMFSYSEQIMHNIAFWYMYQPSYNLSFDKLVKLLSKMPVWFMIIFSLSSHFQKLCDLEICLSFWQLLNPIIPYSYFQKKPSTWIKTIDRISLCGNLWVCWYVSYWRTDSFKKKRKLNVKDCHIIFVQCLMRLKCSKNNNLLQTILKISTYLNILKLCWCHSVHAPSFIECLLLRHFQFITWVLFIGTYIYQEIHKTFISENT